MKWNGTKWINNTLAQAGIATPADISTAIDGIEIGGRNLWKNSGGQLLTKDFVYSSDRSKVDIATLKGYIGLLFNPTYSDTFRIASVPVEPSTEYTFSFVAFLDENSTEVETLSMTFNNYPNGTPTNQNFNLTREPQKFVFRLSTIPAATYTLPHIYNGIPGVFMADFKLEKGNKATDWTPAPEDQISDWSVTDTTLFSYIKNKPTQLSQFTDNIGIVNLTTNQTIGGVKTFTSNVTAPTFIGALSGNASSATKLQTARTIWGQSFNGEGNVSGALTGATTGSFSASVSTPKVDFGNGFTIEPSGTELVFKYQNVVKQRMLSDGTILAVGGITALST